MLSYRSCFLWCCCPLFLLWRIVKASSSSRLCLLFQRCSHVDQSFPAGSGPTARVPCRRTRVDCFHGGEFAPLRFACAFGKHRSPLREHLGLPDAWLVLDSSLLARSSGESKCVRI